MWLAYLWNHPRPTQKAENSNAIWDIWLEMTSLVVMPRGIIKDLVEYYRI